MDMENNDFDNAKLKKGEEIIQVDGALQALVRLKSLENKIRGRSEISNAAARINAKINHDIKNINDLGEEDNDFIVCRFKGIYKEMLTNIVKQDIISNFDFKKSYYCKTYKEKWYLKLNDNYYFKI